MWKLTHKLVLDKRLLVVLMLLSPLLTEGSPAPYRHTRHAGRREQLCEKWQATDHPHEQECQRSRFRRQIYQMNVRDGENATVCDYRVCVDRNPNRMPQEIHRVLCLESGCLCQDEGSFRCTQLKDRIEVWYGVSTGTPRAERVDVEVGCVCAAHHHVVQLGKFNPSISVDK